MKKLISLFICLVIIITSLPISVYASDINSTHEYQDAMEGILTSYDGNQYVITGTLISSDQQMYSNTSSATYAYNIPASLLSSGGSNTEYSPDSGYASTVYLTVYYSHRNDRTEYLLTRVSGYWIISDENASVESASVYYGYSCDGPFIREYDTEDVNNYFSFSTGFTTYIPEAFSAMGAHLTVNYLIGTSRRWSFTLTNLVFNNSFWG